MKKTVFLIILFFMCAQIASGQDQIINGDLFVKSSECVGAGCPDSSAFNSGLGPTVLWVNDFAPQIFMQDRTSGDADFAFLLDAGELGIYNEDTGALLLSIDETGIVQAAFEDSNSDGDGSTIIFEMSADNQDLAKVSDAGFSIGNVAEDFEWAFRTFEPSEGFTATKLGTGGPEFEIQNTTTDFRNVSLELGNGAVCTQGGVWQSASSRDYKENIKDITTTEAMKTLANLKPVKYNLKKESSNDLNVGFIAEDVPELVATKSRKTLSALEIAAVLTKVVQEQQALVAKLSERISELEKQ